MKHNQTFKFKQFPMVVLTALSLAACGVGQKSKTESTTQKSSLSTNASAQNQVVKDKFNQLNTKLSGFKSQKQALCQPDESLMQSIQKQLDSIDKNTWLSRTQKQQAANAVFQNNQAKLEAEKNRMDNCIAQNQNAWDSVNSEEQQYLQSCLPPPPQGDSNRGPGGMQGPQGGQNRPMPPPPFGPPDFDQMDSDQLSSFEQTLSSSYCDSLLR